jgi:pimeloyl-ACP methyl ester carboxylesterase
MRLSAVHDVELGPKCRIRAREYEGSGTPVVYLHGLLDSSEGWHDVATRSGRRSYALDLPGFGNSTCPRYERIASYARDVGRALDELELDRYVLVGHSFGGAVSTAICEQRPEQVAALVLAAPAGYGRIAIAEFAARPLVSQAFQATLPLALLNPVAMSAIYSFWVSNGIRADVPLIGRCREQAFRVVPGARQAVRTIVRCGIDKRAFFRREVGYDGPVIGVWGTRDRLVPVRHAQRMLRPFPHADVQIWEGMGHHPQRERVGQFCALVERACRAADGRLQPRRGNVVELAA